MIKSEAALLLGVPVTASREEARKAFLTRARILHPDRFADGTPEEIRAATDAMAQLNLAFEIFTGDEPAHPHEGDPTTSSREWASSQTADDRSQPPEWADPSSACAVCGWGPAAPLTLNTVTGLVIFWRWGTIMGHYCRPCGDFLYNEAQRSTLLKGWWGVIAPVATVFAFIANLLHVRSVRRLPHPIGRARGTATLSVMPFPPSRPWFARPASMLATLVALSIIAFIAAGLLTPGPRQSGTTAGAPSSGAALADAAPEASASDRSLGTCWGEESPGSNSLIGVDCAELSARWITDAYGESESVCSDYPEGYLTLTESDGMTLYYCLKLVPAAESSALELDPAMYEVCVTDPFDQSESCTPGLTWTYSLCWEDGQGAELERQDPAMDWVPVAKAVVTVDDPDCYDSGSDSTTVTVTERQPGQSNYRITVPNSAQSASGWSDPIGIRVSGLS